MVPGIDGAGHVVVPPELELVPLEPPLDVDEPPLDVDEPPLDDPDGVGPVVSELLQATTEHTTPKAATRRRKKSAWHTLPSRNGGGNEPRSSFQGSQAHT